MAELENNKHVDATTASNPICPARFLPLQTQRGPMWQFVPRNPASSPPISVRLTPTPPPLLLLPPSGRKPSRYWSKLLVRRTKDEWGRESEPIRSCERGRTERATNQQSGGLERAGLHAWVCDRRVDEEQRWQLVFDFIVNSMNISAAALR